jgi:hypothetical protein
MGRLADLLSKRLPQMFPPPPPDPFRTLELQQRLSRLSSELGTIDDGREASGRQQFASGFHATAALLAYDRTLDEACELAGLPAPEGDGPTRRILAEASLMQAGWTW